MRPTPSTGTRIASIVLGVLFIAVGVWSLVQIATGEFRHHSKEVFFWVIALPCGIVYLSLYFRQWRNDIRSRRKRTDGGALSGHTASAAPLYVGGDENASAVSKSSRSATITMMDFFERTWVIYVVGGVVVVACGLVIGGRAIVVDSIVGGLFLLFGAVVGWRRYRRKRP